MSYEDRDAKIPLDYVNVKENKDLFVEKSIHPHRLKYLCARIIVSHF